MVYNVGTGVVIVVVVVTVVDVLVVNDAVELVVEKVDEVVVLLEVVEVVTIPPGVRISTSNSETSTLLATHPSRRAAKFTN